MKFKYQIVLFLLLLVLTGGISSCGTKKTAEQARPEDLLSLRSLGLAYLEDNKLEEAEAQFSRLVALAPGEALGYANLGLVYLRMSRFPEAEQRLNEALKLTPESPDIRLILAKVYELTGRVAQAEELLLGTLNSSHGDRKTLFSLSELYLNSEDDEGLTRRGEYLQRLAESASGNIVPQLYLIDNLIRRGDAKGAMQQMDIVRQRFPEFQPEAAGFFDQTYRNLRTGNIADATTSFMIFQNFLKLTTGFQAGVQELAGPGGPLIGFPVITFGQAFTARVDSDSDIIEAMVFTDVTASAGLDVVAEAWRGTDPDALVTTVLNVGDFDGDGDHDIYLSSSSGPGGESHRFLLRQDFGGKFTDISGAAGLRHSGHETASVFSDYDNDGHLDLFISRDGTDMLYRNVDEGSFSDRGAEAGVAMNGNSTAVSFFDYDHDGDLDLFLGRPEGNRLYRNNADGTFLNVTNEMALSGPAYAARYVLPGDYDDDGDTDLLLVTMDGRCLLLSNYREGRFQDRSPAAGLNNINGIRIAVAADFDNDGYLDLFLGSESGADYRVLRNRADGSFERDDAADKALKFLEGLVPIDALHADFDNDGFQDLLLVTETAGESGRNLFILHNDGEGRFREVSGLIPDDLDKVTGIAVLDYNEDGDLDILAAMADGQVRLLRNDGGNANNFLKISLVGLRTGSARNNHFGIGSKLEVRSSDLYQMKIVDQPTMHFGLGQRSAVDVVRVQWTNGTAQNIFTPTINEDLIEEQELKGSCPFVYTWNGEKYVFARDFMWRSALGMPMGIMGGSTQYAFADAAEDYIKIPGDWLNARDGFYPLQVTTELWEAVYFDQIELITVDHPDSVEIYVDERFTAPPYPDFHIYKIGRKIYPRSATDSRGFDYLEALLARDHSYAVNFLPGKYQGLAEDHDLILDPGPEADPGQLFLFLSGWIFPTDASINVAMAQSSQYRLRTPQLQVPDEKGDWVTVIPDLGFPMGKDKTVVADLSGVFRSSDRRIRILTNMQIYWDEAFFAYDATRSPVQVSRLRPASADLHFRGYSAMYRIGGPNGPHWFDYDKVQTGQKWRDLTGSYTRYGDVLELLRFSDSKTVIANGGDELSLLFREADAPPVPAGWRRDFVLFSAGWVKDGDLNTAEGHTVEPLPFRGMKRYPYGPEESPPGDADYREYLEKYQTRKVDTRSFRRAVAGEPIQ